MTIGDHLRWGVAQPVAARAERLLLRADAGYFAGALARAALLAAAEPPSLSVALMVSREKNPILFRRG
jgi:hypothetical protein